MLSITPNSDDQKHLIHVLTHIENVRNNCYKIAQGLIEKGDFETARQIIANGLAHDESKIRNRTEWLWLREVHKKENPERFQSAYESHVSSNYHHPEAWGGIENMPRVYLGELVCDCAARSSEMGTDLREYFSNDFAEKHNLSKKGAKWKIIKEFLDLLLDKPFS